MPIKKTALIISPQASREGHGAFHGQRTLQAFALIKDWDIFFLTGEGFRQRSSDIPQTCKVIEVGVELNKLSPSRNNFETISRGLQRYFLQNRIFREVDSILNNQIIDVVLFLDGDIFSIYSCWKRNRRKYSDVAWVAAHSTLDFFLTSFSIRSIYKWISSLFVKIMTEDMDSTILYTGQEIKQIFCKRLNISASAANRIVLARFGSDSNDMRLPRIFAREKLGLPLNEKIALFFGLIRSDKRPDIAVEAISRTKDQWWLLIAGKPYSYDEKDLVKIIMDKGIYSRNKLILKYLNEEEVRLIFSAVDILILPHDRLLLSSSGPLSMAFSYRLPVLVADVGYVKEIVEMDNLGFIAKRRDPISFAQKLDEFAAMDKNQIIQLQNHIGEIAAKNSFNSTRDTYIAAFEMAISHKQRGE